MARSTLAVAVATTSPTAAADAEAEAAIIPTKKPPPKATVPAVEKSPARRHSTTRAAASATARSTPAAVDAASDDSDYQATACEDSDSDEAAAALLTKPNPGGTGKKPSKRKGKDAKNTAAMHAENVGGYIIAQTDTVSIWVLLLRSKSTYFYYVVKVLLGNGIRYLVTKSIQVEGTWISFLP